MSYHLRKVTVTAVLVSVVISAAALSHTVTSTETLYGLSQRYKVPVALIRRVNGLKDAVIRQGDNLEIPLEGLAEIVVQPGDTPFQSILHPGRIPRRHHGRQQALHRRHWHRADIEDSPSPADRNPPGSPRGIHTGHRRTLRNISNPAPGVQRFEKRYNSPRSDTHRCPSPPGGSSCRQGKFTVGDFPNLRYQHGRSPGVERHRRGSEHLPG